MAQQVPEGREGSREGIAGSSDAPPGHGILRLSLCLMTLFLTMAAIVQMNDPDSFLWMCIYLCPAIFTFLPVLNLKVFDSGVWWLCLAAYLGAHGAFSFLFVSVMADSGNLSWNMVYSEEGRETCGLVIVTVWLFFLLCVGSNKLRPCKPGNAWLGAALLLFATFPFLCWAAYKIYWEMHCSLPEHCGGIL